MQNFRALGNPLVPQAAGGFAPKPPASSGWRLRSQTPIGLRGLGAPPHTLKTAPIANFWLRAWLLVDQTPLVVRYIELFYKKYLKFKN